MVRALIKIGLAIVGNAVGLWIADLILDDMNVKADGFLIALLIFTVAEVILQPLITKMAMKNAEALQGSSALITTFIALLLTSTVTESLDIDGVSTWILATIIVWLATVLLGIILPAIFLKRALDER